ncbi:PREDICTED: cytochrome P450 71B10-like [Tarenaya hassleriana]|uniref:cytochrome P450 71B10-like n=1 Tax=Tarenaya hassleriana TaxID=28532 RepID=UPI00053C0CCD|nr:PREDICTED: cytochrome P450 71B10-like [Tarenaya hassleriana]
MLLQLGRVPTVVVSSPESAKQVLKVHDIHCCSRPLSEGTRKLSYNHLDVAFSPFDDYWKQKRKICVQELFSTQRVHSFQPIRDEVIQKLIDSISESASTNSPVNLSQKFMSFTAILTCKALFGTSFQGSKIDNDRFQMLVHEALQMLGSFSASDFLPLVGWIFDWFTGLHRRRERSVRDLDTFYEEMIDLHLRENRQGDEDFVDVLLKLEREQAALGNAQITRNHTKAIAMVSPIQIKDHLISKVLNFDKNLCLLQDILIGGIDTSAITMTWAFR